MLILIIKNDNIVYSDTMASLTSAINVQVDTKVKRDGIPCKEMIRALQEAQDIIDGKVESKGYHDVHQMFLDILNEY